MVVSDTLLVCTHNQTTYRGGKPTAVLVRENKTIRQKPKMSLSSQEGLPVGGSPEPLAENFGFFFLETSGPDMWSVPKSWFPWP